LYLYLRQPEDAVRACQQTLAIDPQSLEAQGCLERAYAERRLFDAALQAARATIPPPSAPLTPTARTHPAADLQRIWRWRLEQLERASQSRWINPYTLAVHYALTGATSKAMDALEDAYAKRIGMMVFLARDPAMDPVRRDPRFERLLRKINGTTS
jgi:hypothetical protein